MTLLLKDPPSAAPRVPTGIEGFDEITHGGLPRHRVTLLIGDSGAGKTVFALQTLIHGARECGEPGIVVSFEEDPIQLVANASTFGPDLDELIATKKLFFLDACVSPDLVQGGAFDLTALIAGATAKAAELGAKRIVIDGIDVLLTLLADPAAERRELHRLHAWLVRSGMTALITSKSDATHPADVERYTFMQFMVDATIQLNQRVIDRVALREIRVVKYRGAGYAENAFPMIIGPLGIEVSGPIPVGNPDLPISAERVTTGIEALDPMLSGGFLRGTSILISGRPGAAKTTVAVAFLQAACLRGERALYVGFDEINGEVVRNMLSVGIDLAPHIASGRLLMRAARTDAKSAEGHLLLIKRLIHEHQPTTVVIDPLSALVKAGGLTTALAVAQRLLRHAKSQGITILCTTLLDDLASESAAIQVSTFADTWIELSHVLRGGERNRGLTICKARGTKHSNQLRELVLTDKGVTLADVYLAGGDVLMGTARFEKESEDSDRAQRHESVRELRQIELAQAEAEVLARIEALKLELESKRRAAAELAGEGNAQIANDLRRRKGRLALTQTQGPPTRSIAKPPGSDAPGGKN